MTFAAASGRTIEASPQFRQALRRQKLRERIRRKLEGEAVAHGMSFESWMRVRERNELPGLDRLVDATFAEREAIARLERARLEELRLEQSEGRGIRRKPVVLPDFLAEHPPASGAYLRSVLRVERIIRRFCRVFRITDIDLLSRRRTPRLALARAPQTRVGARHLGHGVTRAEPLAELPKRLIRHAGHRRENQRRVYCVMADAHARVRRNASIRDLGALRLTAGASRTPPR